MTLEAIMKEIQTLPIPERKRLIYLIVETLTEKPKQRSILEFEGIGAEMWQGIDTTGYLDQLRNEWDKSP
jgi:hypothetical protein